MHLKFQQDLKPVACLTRDNGILASEQRQRTRAENLTDFRCADGGRCIANLALVLVATVCLAGCASYGFVDSTSGGNEAGATLRVETLAAPAHLGLNHSELRALLIDELELAGVAVVDSGASHHLVCTVRDHRVDGFMRDLVAEMDVACDIRGADAAKTTFEATGLTTEQLDGAASLPGTALDETRQASMRATIDAFSRLAPDIADAIEDFDDQHRPNTTN